MPYDVASHCDAMWANVLRPDQELAEGNGQAFIVLWDKLTLEDNDLQYFEDTATLTEAEVCQKYPLSGSLLHLAVQKSNAEVVCALLSDVRMDVHVLNGVSRTALHLALSMLSPFQTILFGSSSSTMPILILWIARATPRYN